MLSKVSPFSYSVQGSSHIRKAEDDYSKKENLKFACQDRSFSKTFKALENDEKTEIELYVKNENSETTIKKLPISLKTHKTPFLLCCVCDGHGGSPYFRSEKGAEFAIQVLIEILTENIDSKFLESMKNKDFESINKGFSKGIVKRWNEKVDKDLENDLKNNLGELKKSIEFLDDENKAVSTQYRNAIDKMNDSSTDKKTLEQYKKILRQIYGCTIVAYFETSKYWYALQIGDGDLLISFDGKKFEKPIPDDEKCFLNETTSICDEEAVFEIRFAKKDFFDGTKPKAVFCSTDGVGNSFANEEYLKKFYANIYEKLNTNSNCKSEIPTALSELSEKGSGDDVSISGFIRIIEQKVEVTAPILDRTI